MKYIIFSDIHGNFPVLEAMIQSVTSEDIDGFIFCGDIIGYFYRQEEIIKQFCSWGKLLYAVLGNHDFNYLEGIQNAEIAQKFAQQYGKSYVLKLSTESILFLQGLPKEQSLLIDNKKILIVHGAVSNHLEGRIYPDSEIEDEKLYAAYDVVFLGHTHYRMIKKCDRTLVVNPGSLGQPRDGNGFSYCLFDFNKMEAAFRTVKIDKTALIRDMMRRNENVSLVYYVQKTLGRENV